jgi:hypothetical protein
MSRWEVCSNISVPESVGSLSESRPDDSGGVSGLLSTLEGGECGNLPEFNPISEEIPKGSFYSFLNALTEDELADELLEALVVICENQESLYCDEAPVEWECPSALGDKEFVDTRASGRNRLLTEEELSGE